MEQRDVLRHDRDRLAQAVLRDARNILAVDQDAAGLHVVEALQQREQGRLAAAGLADQADALARLDVEVEVLENRGAVRIARR